MIKIKIMIMIVVPVRNPFQYAVHAGELGHLHVGSQGLGQLLMVGRLGHVGRRHLRRVPQLARLFAARTLQQMPQQFLQTKLGGKVKHRRVLLVACPEQLFNYGLLSGVRCIHRRRALIRTRIHYKLLCRF